MKKVKIKKDCRYTPPGSDRKVPVVAGRVVLVDSEQADKMVAGNVAELVEGPKKKAESPKKKNVL